MYFERNTIFVCGQFCICYCIYFRHCSVQQQRASYCWKQNTLFECFKEFGLKWFHVLAIILGLMWINIRVESFLRLFFRDCFIRISREFLLFMTYDNFKILKNITKHLGINVNFHNHYTIWGFVCTILP